MKNWNGELPSDWHGAKCNSVISSSGNITRDNTSSTPIKCVCEKTGSGWDNGAHCAYDYDCKNNACGKVTGDPLQQCCQYGNFIDSYGKICMNKPCNPINNNTDCPGSTCGIIYDINDNALYQCCPNGAHIESRKKICN